MCGGPQAWLLSAVTLSGLLAPSGCGPFSGPASHSVVTVTLRATSEGCRIEDERLHAEFNVRCRDVLPELRGGRQLPAGATVALVTSGGMSPAKLDAMEAALTQAHYRVVSVTRVGFISEPDRAEVKRR